MIIAGCRMWCSGIEGVVNNKKWPPSSPGCPEGRECALAFRTDRAGCQVEMIERTPGKRQLR